MTDVNTVAPKTIPKILITFKAAAAAFCDARPWAFRPQDKTRPSHVQFSHLRSGDLCQSVRSVDCITVTNAAPPENAKTSRPSRESRGSFLSELAA